MGNPDSPGGTLLHAELAHNAGGLGGYPGGDTGLEEAPWSGEHVRMLGLTSSRESRPSVNLRENDICN